MDRDSDTATRLIDPMFWRLPLADRMAEFVEIRERGPFAAASFENPLTGETEHFHVVTRYAEVVEISQRPKEFCSGQGAVSIPDMPAEALDFFGSFINMDDPRHARQRGIVARSFTPRQLQGVLDSVETICTEVIDGFCEQGEVDLVEVLSQPFPLLVICDMMGIPRSEFDTVLDATNIILGGGDPEFLGDGDPMMAIFAAGMQLSSLMNEIAEERRRHPTDDLTSQLVHNDLGEDMLAPQRDRSLLHPAGGGRQRHHPDRDQPRHEPAVAEPGPASPLAGRPRRRDADGGRGDRPGGVAGDLHAPDRHRPTSRSRATTSTRATRSSCSTGRPTATRGCSTIPSTSTSGAIPTRTSASGDPDPHFCLGAHLARREVSVAFRQILTRLPDIEVIGDPVPLESMGIPLVGGIKRLPVSSSRPPRPWGSEPASPSAVPVFRVGAAAEGPVGLSR